MNSRSFLRAFTLALAVAAPVAANAATPASWTPVQSVNPLVGSDQHGHTYPGATVPFGMVQLSPDTSQGGWDGVSGYHYSVSTIYGFSHTHLSGTGVGGLGDVLLMPTVGDVKLDPGTPGNGYSSHFSHDQEVSTPGYYSVFLDTPKVKAELTATARCGYHRYTFPASANSHIVIDLAHGVGGEVADASLKVENSTTLSGTRMVNDWGGRRNVYFVMQFSRPFDSLGINVNGQGLADGSTDAQGKTVKAFANYATKEGEAIEVKVGISATSVEGARKNLTTEIPAWGFQGVRDAATRDWNDALGAVKVEAADPKIRTTFYSNLYESFLSPVLVDDVDGSYRGIDHQVHPGNGFHDYSTLSLWDTFRAEAPLLTILQPKRVPDMVNSMLNHADQSPDNTMPVWPLWNNETWCMIGYNSAPVVVDAYLKGLRGYDAERIYQRLKGTALQDRNGLGEYKKYGYVLSSGDGQKQSVSRTEEYAYDDWCIAQMAKSLGHTEDYNLFMQRAGNYRNLFDTNTSFMRGRKADGSWRGPFNPKQLVWADYTEANAWQYSWSVMQDIPDLVKISGGDGPFVDKLENLFNAKSDVIANIPDITGLIGQYAHGNEPVHHVAYLYSYAGVPSKTQERVRQIMSTLYNETPGGQPGNNDCGQMSAWYVFSALGFYPVNPAQGIYVIGSPAVDKASITTETGKVFTVTAVNNSPKNIYIQSAALNGKALNQTYIHHTDLIKGGELRLVMGSKPNLKWGKAMANRPPSGMPADFKYAALPAPSETRHVVLPLPIKVVAGSDDAVDGFVADPNMMDGSTAAADGNTNIDVSAPGAAPAGVYKSERYAADYSFSYAVPKTGKYHVRLHFAELFDNGVGERVENIQINGKPVLSNFDILADAGAMNKAVVKDFTGVTPNADGSIVIRVMATPGSPDQNAKISGIEIMAE